MYLNALCTLCHFFSSFNHIIVWWHFHGFHVLTTVMTQLSFSYSITCYKCACKGYQERPKGSISKEDCSSFKLNDGDVYDDDDDFIFLEREREREKPQ